MQGGNKETSKKKEDDALLDKANKDANKFLNYAAASNPLLTEEERAALEADEEPVVSYLRDIYWNVLLSSTGMFYCTCFCYTFFFFYRDRFLVLMSLACVGALFGLISLQHQKNAPRLLPALFHIPRSHFPVWLERPGPALSIIAAVSCGAVVGLLIYAVFGRTAVVYQNSRRYLNAETNLPAGAFADAGRIVFNSEVQVDTHKSAGLFADDGHIYCVAGIKAPSESRIEFWAIGIDCCEAESTFNCGPVTEETAKAGYRVNDSRGVFPKMGDFAYFDAARQKAEANLGLAQAGDVEPIYLRWGYTEDVKNAVQSYRLYAFICIGVATGLYFFSCAIGLWYAMQPPDKKEEELYKYPKYGPDGMRRGHYGPDGMPIDFHMRQAKFNADGMPF